MLFVTAMILLNENFNKFGKQITSHRSHAPFGTVQLKAN